MMEEKWRNFIHDIRGEIFRVHFRKRSNGKWRRMICRAGVKKGVQQPGRFAERDRKNGIIRVLDCQKKAFRSIPLDSIVSIKWRGKIW